MFGEETVFEKLTRDFGVIENDPNKNVDEQDEVDQREASEYEPYVGGAGPSPEQVIKNNEALRVSLQKEGIEAKPIKSTLGGALPEEEAIEVLELTPGVTIGYDRWGFVGEGGDKDDVLDQGDLDDAIEWAKRNVGRVKEESKTDEQEETEEKIMDTVSNDSSFERTVEEFARIEADPSNNVDEDWDPGPSGPAGEEPPKSTGAEENYKPTGEDVRQRTRQFLDRISKGMEFNSLDILDLKRLLKDVIELDDGQEVKKEFPESSESEPVESKEEATKEEDE